ncbi:sodium- and chloride-dependent GABA transporter 1 isoform X1 [Ixodes scapularis]|uniref:sodium- and chloride-dependent GABA transporter 1 isoform X1 n=1 Tax=Ixodes scapularis TaxID=6945 RepID=UPI001A9D6612|nr:sodium- and chloride-dependent GABA transporter 1 isoform X1 [Ixodes scapularis]
MEKKASKPHVFMLSFFSRGASFKESDAASYTTTQGVPICRRYKHRLQVDDNDESSCTTSGLGSQQDLAGPQERGKWTGKADFVFGCISYAVGLGNVWRFPYLCYENGGGAFLIPYFICLVTTAIPMFYLEVAMGQYLSRGGIGIWNMVPMFKGIGIASLTIVTLSNIYYMVIVAWILFYLISSFTEVLPWKHCGNHWNTENCWEYNSTELPPHNRSVTPIVEFWENHVLGISSGLHEMGGMRLELALYLFVSWAVVYVIIWRGLNQSGKIVWVTAIFPYVCLFILLVRGVTLDGSLDGLLFYVTPDWSQLLKPKVWIAAGTQVFYTFGIGVGSVVTLGSYNKFHQNFFRDSAIVCSINPLTSILSGTVIFSVLGHMAYLADKSVGDVVKSGPGLAFLVYPEVVTRMPASTVWSILFFMMLLCLGINSQFCPSEAIVAGIIDQWPHLMNRRKLITFLMVLFQFLLGLPMVTQGGMYLLQLMDNYAVTGITLLFVVFFQAIALAWIYGTSNISDNIKEMLGRRPSILFRVSWSIIVPAMCVAIFLFSVIKYQPVVYAKTYAYPWWGEMMGWFMALVSMVMIPAYMIYFLITTPGSLRQRFIAGVTSQLSTHTAKEEKEYTFSNTALQA